MQETKLNDIKENIKALKDSPLYAMSLGGRELYHSNFWAWLIRQDTQFINVFFDGDFEGASITREEKHHDLTIRTKDEKTHIIENKIKSLATKEQLDRYLFDIFKSYIEIYKTIKNREDLKGKEHNEERAKLLKEPADILRSLYIALDGTAFSEDKKALSEKPKYINNIVDPKDDKNEGTAHAIKNLFVLTGLYKPDDDTERKSNIWKYVSYDKIADEIRKRLDSSEIKNTYKEIVKKYCADVKNLSEVINSLLKDSGTDYTFAHAEQLKSIRFDDTYKKLKMEHFANTIDTQEIGEPQKSGFDLKTEVNFSNKKATITVKYEKTKKIGRSKKRYAIGIQIEEYAFRYFVDAPELATDTFAGKPQDAEVFSALVDKGWFIDKKSGSKFHDRTLVSTGEPCNKYEPNFIYQHYDLGENMGYDAVCSEIYRAFTSKAFDNSFEIIKKLSEKN